MTTAEELYADFDKELKECAPHEQKALVDRYMELLESRMQLKYDMPTNIPTNEEIAKAHMPKNTFLPSELAMPQVVDFGTSRTREELYDRLIIPARESMVRQKPKYMINIMPEDERMYLLVSYEKKEKIKDMGPRWDKDKRRWFVHRDTYAEDTRLNTMFKPWKPCHKTAHCPDLMQKIPRDDRVYICVPYHSAKAAKQLGAVWDGTSRKWFVHMGEYEQNETLRDAFPASVPFVWYVVPFKRKDEAKDMGCTKFDKELKAWGCDNPKQITKLDEEFHRHKISHDPTIKRPKPIRPPQRAESPESLTLASNPRTYFVVNTADEAERTKAEATRLRWDKELMTFYTRSRRIKAAALNAGFRVLR